MTQRFTAIIEREDDTYVALCPELDIASQGESVSEARSNLREAIELFSSRPPRTKSRAACTTKSTSPRWRSLLGRLKILSGAEVCKILLSRELFES